MQNSIFLSWQTLKEEKGNHRRTMKTANFHCGTMENIHNTPSFEEVLFQNDRWNIVSIFLFIEKGKEMKKLLLLITSILLVTSCSSAPKTEAKNTFTVGMECNYAPFNWSQSTASDTAKPISKVDYCDGYDVVIATKLAEAMGKEVVIKAVSWEGLIQALNSNEIDAIIAGMTETPERAESVDFTTPYYDSQNVMIVRKEDAKLAAATSIQDFSGYKVLGQANTLYDEIIDQINGVIHVTPQDSYPRMILSLQQKEVDAITAELPVAQGVVDVNKDLVIVHFDKDKGFVADASVSIAISKKNPELLKEVQKALDSISEETRQQLMQEATKRQPASN